MAIYAPGRRDRHNRPLQGGRRSVLATLSLVAMVDMFTVLVVFLLQNYQTTGEVIDISDDVKLPKAGAVRELKPAHVVVVSKDSIILDKDIIATFAQVKEQKDWKIDNLFNRLTDRFRDADAKRQELAARVREAVQETKPDDLKNKIDDERRVTVQADRAIDFLTVKKVMYTLSEAGASEINFAVIKDDKGAAH
jgi:biopolymer transport protein ExbD